MRLHGRRARCSPRARGDLGLQELTGSSCCGNGCNWREQEGHRIQGPRRRKSVQQHQPKPGGRSNRQTGEQAEGPWGWDGAGGCPTACPPHGTGRGSLLVHAAKPLLPVAPSPAPSPVKCIPGAGEPPRDRGSSGSCSSRIEQRRLRSPMPGRSQGEPQDPRAHSCPGRFSPSITALITFNENSQVLPGNYSQEAYCQARARTWHKQNPAAMRWVIQLEIYISKSLSRASCFCRNEGPIALQLQQQGQTDARGWACVLGRGSGCCHPRGGCLGAAIPR